MRLVRLVVGVVALSFVNCGDFDPCPDGRIRKAELGEGCDLDGDCRGVGVVCGLVHGDSDASQSTDRKSSARRCRCHQHYQRISDPNSSLKFCEKLPDRVGASCQGSCRFPLSCRGGQCSCIRRGYTKLDSDTGLCKIETRVGTLCSRHQDCTAPFTACAKDGSVQKCRCVEGTAEVNGECRAEPNCPVGAAPLRNARRELSTCVRFTNNQEVVENMINSGAEADNCTTGSFCFTPEGSIFGHCCASFCPLSAQPEEAYSCHPTAAASDACPEATHFCHRVSGAGYAFASCCRRPCTSPTPLFIQGACYEPAWLYGPCQRNEQCGGGVTMQCSSGTCQCKSGFEALNDPFVSRTNKPQTCVARCSDSKLVRDDVCLSPVQRLEDIQCLVQEQCPKGGLTSGCYRGRCRCLCGMVDKGSYCETPPDPTTQAPQPGGSAGASGGASGAGGIGNLLQSLTSLFNG